MTLIVILVVIATVSLIGLAKIDSYSAWHLLCGAGAIISMTVLLMILLIGGIGRLNQRESLVRIEAFRTTLSEARSKQLSDVERAAILKEIAEWNEWIAAEKYWNSGAWDIFHIDEVDDLQPLK